MVVTPPQLNKGKLAMNGSVVSVVRKDLKQMEPVAMDATHSVNTPSDSKQHATETMSAATTASTRLASESDALKTPLQKFYTGKVLLITGGTGFLGKLMIEKLLRTCPDVEHIYIVVRHKRGKTGRERIDEYFNDLVFERMKKENPEFATKLTGMIGDMASPMLGLSENDQNTLRERVDIVIHAAATVNFAEKLSVAVGINMLGTRSILALAKQMPNLKALVHVSTAYSNCHMGDIEERVYEYPGTVTWRRLVQLVECLNDSHLEVLTDRLLGDWPNTYTFTKALTERMLSETREHVPLGIFRPAIVVSTFHEPMPGWIDNVYGPTGVIAGIYSGMLRVIRCNTECMANIVPGDMCACAILTSAWDIYNEYQHKSLKQGDTMFPIYNYVSADNKITWGELYVRICSLNLVYPISRAVWHPSCHFAARKITANILALFLHVLPAYLLDLLLRCIGKAPKMVKQMKRTSKLLTVLEFFSTRSWHYGTWHTCALWNKLSDADKQLFDFSIKDLDWAAYFDAYIRGMRLYIHKDDLATLPTAKKRAVRLYWISKIFNLTFIAVVVAIFIALLFKFSIL